MARTVLVTGAGGGIGQVLARRLLAKGDQVIASDRQLDLLTDLAASGCTRIAIDVGDDASVQAAYAGMTSLDAVVHCAAVAPLGTVEFMPAASVAAVHNINALGSLRILQASLPLLRKAPSGRLVMISSVWGKVSGPFVSAYASSKHAIEAMADAARREMAGQPIRISLVEPGVVKTPMYFDQIPQIDAAIAALSPEETAIYGGLYRDHRKLVAGAGKSAVAPEQVCAVIERCLDSATPRARYRVGTDARTLVALSQMLSDRMLDRVFRLMYKG
jgi:NAD(P)-dependent dehydrogenase (short-subunit alcohol dehydrogenase family)